MVIYDKKQETICVSTEREVKVFAPESAEEEDSCASVADSETAEVAAVFATVTVDKQELSSQK